MLSRITHITATLFKQPIRQLSRLATRPKLKNIFGEDHKDPATTTILNQLAPNIKNFKDEIPKSMSLDERIKKAEHYQTGYESMRKQYEAFQLDITNPDHFKLFLEKVAQHDPRGPMTAEEICSAYSAISCSKGRQSNLKLLKTFQKNNTKYSGMNLELVDMPIESIHLFTEAKDQSFVDDLTQVDEDTDSRVGYGHFPGMQNKFVEKLSFKTALASCNFFYVRSMDFHEKYHPEKLTKAGQLPLGYTDIDLRKVGETRALQIIQEQTELKQEQLAALVDETQSAKMYRIK